MQAERAALGASGREGEYSYSEQVFPLIRDRLGNADKERRLAEDRLSLFRRIRLGTVGRVDQNCRPSVR